MRVHCGFFFFGCLVLPLAAASDRFFTESSCEMMRRVSQGIAANFNIKYISYLKCIFIFSHIFFYFVFNVHIYIYKLLFIIKYNLI